MESLTKEINCEWRVKVKNRLTFYVEIYLNLFVQNLKSLMSYRADFILSMIVMIFINITGFISFYIIFDNFPTIMGWNCYEMIFLYGFSLIALTPAQCCFENNWNLRGVVFSGDFIKYCFKPINIFFYYISETFDIKGLGQFGFGVFTLCFAWDKLNIDFSLLVLIKLMIQLFGASLFMIGILNFASAICFYTVNGTYYIMMLANKFKDYARYPVTIFNGVLRFVFTFIIPIAFMTYYPSLEFLDEREKSFFTYLTPIYGLVFFYLSYRFWMHGAKKYNGTGS